MKTQISQLRSGREWQILNVDVDYSSLPKASNHHGHAGTSRHIANAVWDQIVSENPEYLDIEIQGHRDQTNRYPINLTIRLTANWSLSRKSCSYYARFDRDTLKTAFGMQPSKLNEPSIIITSCGIEITNGKNLRRNLCPSFITIK